VSSIAIAPLKQMPNAVGVIFGRRIILLFDRFASLKKLNYCTVKHE